MPADLPTDALRAGRSDELRHLQALIDVAPVGLALLDSELRFRFVNPALAAINGLPVADHLGKSVWEIVPELQTIAEPVIRRVLQSGTPVTGVELRGTTPAAPGIVRDWIEHYFPQKAPDGQVEGVAILLEEVTARKRAEEELRLSQERLASRVEELETFLNVAPIGISLARDPECRDVWVNPALRALLRLAEKNNASAAGENADALPYRIFRDGVPVAPGDMPMQRSCLFGQPVLNDELDIVFRDGSVRTILKSAQPLFDSNRNARGCIAFNVDITERKHLEEKQAVLTNELHHRVKNMMATVQSIATQTMRDAGSLRDFSERFSSRLQTLGQSFDSLIRQNWQPALLSELIRDALEPFGGEERVSLHGTDIRVAADKALLFNLVVHELATNAAKFGAWSVLGGSVEIEYRRSEEIPDLAVFRWTERGGPPVRSPRRKGFGSRLIEFSVSRDLGGRAAIEYRPEGLECVIHFAPDNSNPD